MADEVPPVDPAAMMQQVMAAIQGLRDDNQVMNERMERLEQRLPPLALPPAPAPPQANGPLPTHGHPPPPAPPAPARPAVARNLFPPQDVRLEDPIEQADDTPDPYHEADRYFGVPNQRQERAPAHQGKSDIKLTPPIFTGKANPEAYMDWERRMEYIFDCYEYTERKKVTLAAAQLTENALSWWDREVSERRRHHFEQITTWASMKFLMRRRYVPPHFHRDLQKRFRRLS